MIAKSEKHFIIRSRNMMESSLDLAIELRTAQGNELVRNIVRLPGITSTSLLSYDEGTF